MDVDLHRLTVLAGDLAMAKASEEKVKAARIAVEEKIAAMIPGPDKGQKTVTLEDGTKVKVERGLNYRADFAAIDKLQENGTIDFSPVKTKTTRELDEVGYEWYRTNEPDTFPLLSQHVVVTAKKVAVSIQKAK